MHRKWVWLGLTLWGFSIAVDLHTSLGYYIGMQSAMLTGFFWRRS